MVSVAGVITSCGSKIDERVREYSATGREEAGLGDRDGGMSRKSVRTSADLKEHVTFMQSRGRVQSRGDCLCLQARMPGPRMRFGAAAAVN